MIRCQQWRDQTIENRYLVYIANQKLVTLISHLFWFLKCKILLVLNFDHQMFICTYLFFSKNLISKSSNSNSLLKSEDWDPHLWNLLVFFFFNSDSSSSNEVGSDRESILIFKKYIINQNSKLVVLITTYSINL